MDARELTRAERAAIRKLVKRWCANYDPEYGCLPLGCECYMLNKWWTGAYCRYFREAVLPLAPELARALSGPGHKAELRACAVCGREQPEEPVLGLENGGVCCRACRKADFGATVSLDAASLAALRRIVTAPAKQIMAFELDGASLKTLAAAAEKYLLAHTERSFSTLDYWKKVR